MTEPRLMMQKLMCLIITGIFAITILLSFGTPGRQILEYVTEDRSEQQDNISVKQCSNLVWNKHFHIDSGSRILQTKMLENISVSKESQCQNKSLLVYRCDSSIPCGGWADRQKGLISTFLLALITNRVFVIDMIVPCKLDIILHPNVYNWSVCKSYVNSAPRQFVITFNRINNLKFARQIAQFDFDREWTKQVVVLRLNAHVINGIKLHKQARSRLEWLLNVTYEEAIHLVLNTLFTPNDRMLDNAVNLYKNSIKGRKLACAHIRMGRNPSISHDNKPRFGKPNVTAIFEHLKQYDKDSEHVIYIAADSNQVKQFAKNNFTSYVNINQTIVHVDRLGKFGKLKTKACDGLYTAIMEQHILSSCDILILTDSGFGAMAAYMRGISEGLYIYHPREKRVHEINLTNIQQMLKFQ